MENAREVEHIMTLFRSVVKEFAGSDISLVEIEIGSNRIRVERGRGAVVAAPPTAVAFEGASAPAAHREVAEHKTKTFVKSPIVGTFYVSPRPDAEPYVRPGARVAKGETLCIIEAMKMMNEIESDRDGVIGRVLVDNGVLVEYGQPLFEWEE